MPLPRSCGACAALAPQRPLTAAFPLKLRAFLDRVRRQARSNRTTTLTHLQEAHLS